MRRSYPLNCPLILRLVPLPGTDDLFTITL